MNNSDNDFAPSDNKFLQDFKIAGNPVFGIGLIST